MNMIHRAGTVLLVTCAMAAPAAAQNREHQQLAADLRILEQQQQQLALAIVHLAEAVTAVTARLDQATDMTRKGFADQKLVLDSTTTDLRNIRERLDDSNVRLGTLREEVEAIRTAIPAIVQALAQIRAAMVAAPAPAPDGVAPGAEPAPEPVPPVTPPSPIPSTVGQSPSRMYEQAFADYAAGQYTLALSGFDAFLRTYPTSERADDAQFYIGETYAAMGRFADAVAAYNAVIQNYPTGDQVPLAYYKRGTAQDRLGQVDAARDSWETVVRQYPDSDGGRLAKQRLDSRAAAPRPAAPAR